MDANRKFELPLRCLRIHRCNKTDKSVQKAARIIKYMGLDTGSVWVNFSPK